MRMNYYLTADLHLGHETVARERKRPDNAEDLILSSIRRIEDHAVHICLGDVAFDQEHEWHQRIREQTKARAIMVMGNHDKRTMTWYYERGWDFICVRFDLVLFGKRLAFSHKPVVDDGSFDFNIHGHFHDCPAEYWESELKARLTEKHLLIKMEHSYKALNVQHVIANPDRFSTLSFM